MAPFFFMLLSALFSPAPRLLPLCNGRFPVIDLALRSLQGPFLPKICPFRPQLFLFSLGQFCFQKHYHPPLLLLILAKAVSLVHFLSKCSYFPHPSLCLASELPFPFPRGCFFHKLALPWSFTLLSSPQGFTIFSPVRFVPLWTPFQASSECFYRALFQACVWFHLHIFS